MALSNIKVTGLGSGNFLDGIRPSPAPPMNTDATKRLNLLTTPQCGDWFQITVNAGIFYIDWANGVQPTTLNLIINGQIVTGAQIPVWSQ